MRRSCSARHSMRGRVFPGILRPARCLRFRATVLLSRQLLCVRSATHMAGVIAAMLLPRAHWIHKLILCRPEPQLTYAAEARANRLPRHQEPRECPREAVFAVTRQAAIVAHCSDVPSRRYLRRDGRPALSGDEARVLVRAHKLGANISDGEQRQIFLSDRHCSVGWDGAARTHRATRAAGVASAAGLHAGYGTM